MFFMNFHQMKQPLRNTLAKTLEHLYFGTSHYLLNAVVLLPNFFNSNNCEGCTLKLDKLPTAFRLCQCFSFNLAKSGDKISIYKLIEIKIRTKVGITVLVYFTFERGAFTD